MNMRDIINLLEDAGQISPFQQWFAGSKVVDAQGNPLKLYHGTSKDMDFKAFKIPKNGVWFTNDPKSASDYSMENDSQNTKYEYGKFVSVHTASRVIPCYVKAVNPVFMDSWPDEVQKDNYRRAQGIYFDRLRAQGHDAIIFKGGMIVVVLGSPNQIKSAIGNKTFNPDKKNIDEAADSKPLTRETLSNTIISLAHKYIADGLAPNLYEINNGLCDDFAGDIERMFGHPSSLIGLWADSLTVDGEGYEWDIPLLEKHWPKCHPTHGLTWADVLHEIPSHVWMVFENRHYDAECPEGVDNFFELPLIRRGMERLSHKK